MDDYTPVEKRFTTWLVGVYPRTGEFRPGSVRIFRSATPPPAPEETWARPPKYRGELTWLCGLKSVAEATWNLNVGEVRAAPRELADVEIRAGRARPARRSELPTTD